MALEKNTIALVLSLDLDKMKNWGTTTGKI